jgi:hypothetical protein
MRVEVDKTKDATAVMFFRRDSVTPEVVEKIGELRELLKMPQGQQKFNLVYSPVLGATP